MRLRSPAVVTAVLLTLASAPFTGVLPQGTIAIARADEVTVSQDNLRTGWDAGEPGLGPASDGGPVGGPAFGQLFRTHLNGQIYAQPVVAGSTVIVATETNHVYGLNAVTGAVKWSRYLGRPEPAAEVGCTDLTPDVGITGTPVYDPATGSVYLVAVVNNGPTPSQPHVYAYALDAQTGAARTGWPVVIHGSPVNDPAESFNPLAERERVGLLLLGGWVYAAFASYCDYQPYVGYVAGIKTTTHALTLWSDEAGLTNSQGGIWQSGAGIMSDGAGRIFVATGNGVSPPPGRGASPPGELGDSVVRLKVASNGMLSAADFFSPADAPTLDADDQDFGSGGPVGLPFGTASYPDLLVQAGKDGRVFLLNRNDLGGREQGTGGTDDAVSQSGPYGGLWGHPAAFGPDPTVSTATSGDYVYYVGSDDVLRYLQFGVSGSGTPELTDVANSSTSFGFSSGSPVVTSDGDSADSGVVWEVDASSEAGTGATLQAFAAQPASTCTASAPCTMTPIWSAPIGTAGQFTVPATDGGRVYVGTRDGSLFGFGSPDSAPLTGAPVNFGRVGVGRRGRTETVTMTASSSVRVTGLSVTGQEGTGPFRLGTARAGGTAARFPVTLTAGEVLSVPVTFAPARTGGVTGAVQATTASANFPAVSVSLTGQGTAPGLQAAPATLVFGRRPVGTTVTKAVLVTNASTVAETVTAVGRPAAPFRASLPARGRVVRPGQSVPVAVTFRPSAVGNRTSSVTISTSGRPVLRVALTGAGEAAVSRLTASANLIRFGNVQVGTRATRTIVVTNGGNLPVVISRASALLAPFGSQAASLAGLPLTPRYAVNVSLTFTPASTGRVTATYVLHWRDAAGRHVRPIVLTGTGVPAARGLAVPPPGGGWTLNGAATMNGRQLVLAGTGRSARNAAGSAIYPVPERAGHLDVRFKATLTGDGGMTVGLLRTTSAGPLALGGPGRKLGFGGLAGIAVTLASGTASGHRSGGSVGIAVGSGRGLRYLASAAVTGLAVGSHEVGVAVNGGRIVVTLGGKRVLSARPPAAAIPASSLLAFTGGTESGGGSEAVAGVAITATGRSVPVPGGGWSFNGSAAMSHSAAVLTRAAKAEAGAVVYPVPVRTNGLRVIFSAQLSGGTGANGLTMALLNPATDSASSVGADGTSLGLGGLTGVGVALDTVQIASFTTSNVAAIVSTASGNPDLVMDLGRLAMAIPPLRPGPGTVTVEVARHGTSYIMTVWLDGEQILQQGAPGLGPTALLAFTGSTGGRTDVHLVRDVAISAPG
jgi:outer membrane protein assembly factor BamB